MLGEEDLEEFIHGSGRCTTFFLVDSRHVSLDLDDVWKVSRLENNNEDVGRCVVGLWLCDNSTICDEKKRVRNRIRTRVEWS